MKWKNERIIKVNMNNKSTHIHTTHKHITQLHSNWCILFLATNSYKKESKRTNEGERKSSKSERIPLNLKLHQNKAPNKM